jgi:hypothetical protein
MRTKRFRLGDNATRKEQEDLGVEPKLMSVWWPPAKDGKYVAAIRTDDFRAPRKNEWYLSGARPVAYRAPNDLGIRFRIMRLVAVERTTTVHDRIQYHA